MSWLKRLFGIASEPVAKEAPKELPLGTSNKNRDSADIHAMRMNRIPTDRSDADRLGIRYLHMHLSALSPTTRPSHAARHGHLYTEEEMQEWWASDENDVECKCSTVMILVDENGDPMTPSIIERARKTYEDMKVKGNGEWTKS